MPIVRGNHFSARSTACSEATSVAPRRLARLDEGADALVGERRIERRDRLVGEDQVGPLVEHAGDADALQLAAREAVAAVEDAVAEVEPRERRARACGIARHEQRGERLPGRPRAEPAGEHGGDDAQPRRDRRALVDDADARAQAAQRAGAERPRDRRRRSRRGPRSAAATCRARAPASSCRRPTARSPRRARRARARADAGERAVPVGVDVADAVEAHVACHRRARYLTRPAERAADSMPS